MTFCLATSLSSKLTDSHLTADPQFHVYRLRVLSIQIHAGITRFRELGADLLDESERPVLRKDLAINGNENRSPIIFPAVIRINLAAASVNLSDRREKLIARSKFPGTCELREKTTNEGRRKRNEKPWNRQATRSFFFSRLESRSGAARKLNQAR